MGLCIASSTCELRDAGKLVQQLYCKQKAIPQYSLLCGSCQQCWTDIPPMQYLSLNAHSYAMCIQL